MARKNENLLHAKAVKNDEFFTNYADIANEVSRYRDQFKDQIVYCNCDDPSASNFWRFFHNNFASFGLKKLISTHYVKNAEPSYALIYTGGDDFHMDAGEIIQIDGNGAYTAGDFRSDACLRLLDEATLVCTNPPFSLWIPYVQTLTKRNKHFLIIGNKNVITFKSVFPLLKDGKMWLGYNDVHDFVQPDGTVKKFGNVGWFTNLDVLKRHDGLWHRNEEFDQTQAHCYYEGNEMAYPHYDNYDAIEVNKTKNIPIDYAGVMGVPITFLDKYSPDEFEILGITSGRDEFERCAWPTKRYENCVQHNSDGSCANGSKMNTRACLRTNKTNGIFYTADNADGCLTSVYARILIRNLHPISKANDRGY